ncbi:response regulator transcription factor [bacterium]|nr:response regulator transcription factor [bacterium]
MRVLIVEDDKRMAEILKKGLEEENHSVTLAFDGEEGLEFAGLYDFDVLVLDVMLPRMDGFEVARQMRQKNNQTPILMLTARDTIPDIVAGLDLGADDYLTKPFAFSELLARLRSASRHRSIPLSSNLQVANLELDPAKHRVTRGGREIKLSATEFRLLEFLMRRAGRVVSRSSLVEGVWGFDRDIEENTLDAFVRLLRIKIDRNHDSKLIHTVRGFGYCLRETPET